MMTYEELRGALRRSPIYIWIRLGPGRDPEKVLLHKKAFINQLDSGRRTEEYNVTWDGHDLIVEDQVGM